MKRLFLIIGGALFFAGGFAAGSWDWITVAVNSAGEYPVLVRPGQIRIYDTLGGRVLAAFEHDGVQLFKPGQQRPAVNLALETTGGYIQLSDYYGSPRIALSGATGTVSASRFMAGARHGRTEAIEFIKPDGTVGRLEFAGGLVVE